MSKQEHKGPHKYIRGQFKISGTIIFKCSLSGCNHFVYEPLIISRLSLCWRCGDPFVITRKSIRNKKLHCEDCTKGKERPKISEGIMNDLNKILRTE